MVRLYIRVCDFIITKMDDFVLASILVCSMDYILRSFRRLSIFNLVTGRKLLLRAILVGGCREGNLDS